MCAELKPWIWFQLGNVLVLWWISNNSYKQLLMSVTFSAIVNDETVIKQSQAIADEYNFFCCRK